MSYSLIPRYLFEEMSKGREMLFFFATGYSRSFYFIFQETALVFVKEGDFGCLTQLLSPVEFARLKPLVLLLGWPYCYSCENAKNLLEALWNPTVSLGIFIVFTFCQP